MIWFYLVVHPEDNIVRRDFLKLEKFEQGLEEAQHVAVWLETADSLISLKVNLVVRELCQLFLEILEITFLVNSQYTGDNMVPWENISILKLN